MAGVHTRVTAACQQYYLQYRRQAHVTPKSFIASVEGFKQLYRSGARAPAVPHTMLPPSNFIVSAYINPLLCVRVQP